MSLDRNKEVIILESIFEKVIFCLSQFIEASARASASHQIQDQVSPRMSLL